MTSRAIYLYIGLKPITICSFDSNKSFLDIDIVRVSAVDRPRVVITNHETTHRSPRSPTPAGL